MSYLLSNINKHDALIMKTLLRHFIILLLPTCIFAQPTYQLSDYANPGDEFVVSRTNTGLQGFDFTQNGANQSWDFSDIELSSQNTTNILDPADTGYEAAFIIACILDGGGLFECPALWGELTDLGVQDVDTLSLGGLTFSNVVRLQRKATNTLEETILALTFGLEGNSLPFPIIFEDIDTVYQFPLQYQDEHNSTALWSLDLTPVGLGFSFTRGFSRSYEVEGWGSLTTPFQEFPNVLKIRTELNFIDTLVVGETVVPIPSQQVIYQWLDPDFGIPVFEATANVIAGNEIITGVAYIDSLRCISPGSFFIPVPPLANIDPETGVATINFTNLSSNADSYTWDFDDGTTSGQQSPSHDYDTPGTYDVQLIACNQVCNPLECDTFSFPITIALVDQEPIASFNFSPDDGEICAGDAITFINNSLNADSFEWTFGEFGGSTEASPTVTFPEGTHLVSLIASNGNTTDTMTTVITALPVPEPDLGGNVEIDINSMITFSPGNFASYSWFNGSTEPEITLVASELGVGIFSISVTVTDQNGCSATDTIVLTISLEVSVDEIAATGFKLFPNPASEQVTITWNQGLQANNLQLYTTQGQLLIDRNLRQTSDAQAILTLAEVASGLYYVRLILGDGKSVVQKIVVE